MSRAKQRDPRRSTTHAGRIGIVLALLLGSASPVAWCAGGGSEATAVVDGDYQAAMNAVKSKDWNQAIARMSAYVRRNPDNADAWNELGHAHRKVGDLDSAFKDYARALQIDPKHKNAHEYLGEAYLQADDLARAEQELRTLDSLCFLPCEQYSDLKESVRQYKSEHDKASGTTPAS